MIRRIVFFQLRYFQAQFTSTITPPPGLMLVSPIKWASSFRTSRVWSSRPSGGRCLSALPASWDKNRLWPRVRPSTDQERAASLALHHGVDALPVVDAEGCALGVMPSQALLHVLRREHVEDLHVLAGIQRESSQARHAIEDPPLRRAQETAQAVMRNPAQALDSLEAHSSVLARIFECRYFGGSSEEETARALGLPLRTVQRGWMRARAWLRYALDCGPRAGSPASGPGKRPSF